VTRDDLDAAKGHVRQCEDEIESIKGALRRLSSVEDGDQPNQLDISMLKVRMTLSARMKQIVMFEWMGQ
jgi:hypothetical protein